MGQQATGNKSRKRLLRKTPWLCVMGRSSGEEKRGTAGVPAVHCQLGGTKANRGGSEEGAVT